MNVEKVRNWALAVIAVGGAVGVVLGPVQSSVRDLIAQEAAAEVQKQMQPTAQKLESVVDLLRRQQDFEMTQVCLKSKSELRCRRESEHRWKVWAWQDCRDEKGADHPQCVEPEPLEER